jgi:hypothetical protein
MFMTQQLYRKAAICAMVGYASLSVAQYSAPVSKVKPHAGPRAISVLETDDKGQSRLVPVTVLFQNQYYDASQYQANPVPMAAEAGTVYDVLNANVPIGLFSTSGAQEVKGTWVSLGSMKKPEPVKEKPAKVEVDLGKNEGPVLKRRGQASSGGGGDAKNTPPADDDPDRPTLKKPASESAPAAAPAQTTASTKSSAPAASNDNLTRDTNENDPDRPVLRKTTEGTNPTNVNMKMPDAVVTTKVAAPAKVAPDAGGAKLKQNIAVSDEEKTDYRPFGYQLKDDEKKALVDKLQKIAATQLVKFALAHGGVKIIPKLTFNDFDLRAFDVDYSNNPELVFTASYSPVGTAKTKPVTYYLTLVAREDANGDLNPLFSQITDSTRLDEYARLELIDAVDADGLGRGSLLFREYTDSGKAFVMYRVDAYNLTKLFEGASGE